MNRFLNFIFYTLKPSIPRSLQLMIRRRIAAYKLCRCAFNWPINPTAGMPPLGWKGWPKGKTFAFVLSHDVDSMTGYQNVRRLAEIEEKLGFRSVFNFVPERYGRISLDLLDELRGRGFDIGVHGLRHDGKLFISKGGFDRQASKINTYLKEWKSRAFSSPSMHRNFAWLPELNIDFAISSFDTDPFEPNPEGVGTIFPFHVGNGNSNRRYLELPYTLPQDHLLFVILRETKIDIWIRKLNWVAENGGMALLNTHPDYMSFNGVKSPRESYPVKLYIAFLEYVKSRYAGEYHHAIPSEITDFWNSEITPT